MSNIGNATTKAQIQNRFVEPRFGVLRPQGNFKGLIDGVDIEYQDLWKHDQYIHDVQFKPLDSEFTDIDEEGYSPQKSLILKFQKIKELKKFKCHFCGFEDRKYLEIHHLDSNHFNNEDSNLVPACILCHRQHHLLWLSLCDHAELGSVDVKYLPQTELNHLQRISIVLADHPTRASDIGRNGKLGALISLISNGFSRPLHAFMVSNAEKLAFRNQYIFDHQVKSPFTDSEVNFNTLQGALNAINSRKPSPNEITLLNSLDKFIPPLADPNGNPEDHRAKHINQIKECVDFYEKALNAAFEKKFNDDVKVFTIFELAIALKDVDFDTYKDFNPPHLKLIFKPTIFTKEQIQYYKKLGYFNTTTWQLGTENDY